MIRFLLKISFSILVIGYLASHADGQKLLGYLQQADLTLLSLAAVILYVAPAIQAVRWRSIIRMMGASCTYLSSLTSILIGLFFNQILPSTIGGDAIRMWRAHRSGIAADVAISSVILDRVVALLALIVIVFLATPVMYRLYGDRPELAIAPLFVALGIVAFTALFLLDRLPSGWKSWGPVRMLAQLSASARLIMLRPVNGSKTLGISIAIHMLSVSGVFTVTQALSLDIRYLDCVLLIPPVILFSVLPISIAGWGVREGALITAFAIIGIDYDAAFTVSVLFGLGVMSAGIPGALLWVASRTPNDAARAGLDKLRRFLGRDRDTTVVGSGVPPNVSSKAQPLLSAAWKRGLVAGVSLIVLTAVVVAADAEGIVSAFRAFQPGVIAAMIGLIAVNLIVVSFRLARILAHFGVPLGARTISRASVSGHIASLFMNSLFGQIVGRHISLNRSGIPAMTIASITTYERIILFFVSGILCICGGAYFIGAIELTSFVKRVPIFDVILLSILCFALTIWFGRSALDRQILRLIFFRKTFSRVLEIVGITLVAQAFVLATFVLGAIALDPELVPLEVIAAAAVVSFAASIPITVNGWGVRELASAYMFGAIGMSLAEAVALSILVGLCSTLVILLAWPAVMLTRPKQTPGSEADSRTFKTVAPPLAVAGFERLAAYLLALAAAVTIFFQLHLVFSEGLPSASMTTSDHSTLSVNLSDPLAIVALAAMFLYSLSKRRLPQWQVPNFSLVLIGIGLLLLLAFVIGAFRFGVTQWALTSRLIGWLVVLGYMSIGFLLVEFCGRHSVRRFAETLILTASVVVITHIVLRFLNIVGFETWTTPNLNFDGYTGNRNAFAFQLLVCLGLLLGYSRVYMRGARKGLARMGAYDGASSAGPLTAYRMILGSKAVLFVLCFGCVAAAIFFAGSRGGYIVGSTLIAVSWIWRVSDRRLIELGILFAIVISQAPDLLLYAIKLASSLDLFSGVGGTFISQLHSVQSNYSGETSQTVRMAAILQGLRFWTEAPLFGKGLGFFLHHSDGFMQRTVVIHNTAVWLLTELGLVGLLSLAGVFLLIGWSMLIKRNRDGAAWSIVLILLCFAMFSMVHDIFYQRVFWLTLGVCVAGATTLDRFRKPGPTVVCHLITGLKTGGAERMLTRIVTAQHSSGYRNIVVSLMDEGDFGDEIESSGAKLYTLGMTRELLSVRRLPILIGILMREKPDIIITWLYYADLLGLIAGWFVGVRRVIWNIRCSDMMPGNRSFVFRIMMWLLVRLSGFPSMIIVNSISGKRYHEGIGYAPQAWQVIGNGVDLQRFRPDPAARDAMRRELGIPADAAIVGHVARFHPMKDYDTLLSGIDTIAERLPNSHFVLVGLGIVPTNTYFANALSNSRFADRIHLLGSRSDTPALMASFDIFIQSSAYGEGSPNVVIEAMACAVPCVVTDVGDSAAIVGATGRVVPPRNAEEMAAAALSLLNLPCQELAALGEMSRQRTLTEFDINAVVERYRAVIENTNPRDVENLQTIGAKV